MYGQVPDWKGKKASNRNMRSSWLSSGYRSARIVAERKCKQQQRVVGRIIGRNEFRSYKYYCINFLHKTYTLLQSCEENQIIQRIIVDIGTASCGWMNSKPTFRQWFLSPSPGTCLPPKSVHVMIHLPDSLEDSLWLDAKVDGRRSQEPALLVLAFTFVSMLYQKRTYLFSYTHCLHK